ncbi:venom metalloproteinase antarease TserMP_A-like [Ornithodoros turicata]|uniref:venom metalloproteinase antarease TserMP_A-like n=1 Tax=Ornithodoros turicata TaxID=34597 RepID=UPI00313A26FB
MKVNLAAQTLSASIADALEFCDQDLNIASFQGCEATVSFLRRFDRLFDILNSRNPLAKNFKVFDITFAIVIDTGLPMGNLQSDVSWLWLHKVYEVSVGNEERDQVSTMSFTFISAFAILRLLSRCTCTCTGKEPPTVFYPVLLAGRSADGAKSVYIDDQLTLNLEKTSVLSEPFTLTDEGKVPRDSVVDVRDIEDNLYHDPDKLSAVIMRDQDTGIEMEGIINKTHRIQPSITSARSADGQLAHEIYCTEEGGHDYDIATKLPESGRPPIIAREDSQFQFPSAIYPSIHVVSDYHHSGNVTQEQLVRYIAIFFASVNLRLKELYDPAVRFNVRGVTKLQKGNSDILSETRNGFHTYLDDSKTLEKFRQNYRVTRRTEDIAILLTGLDMASFPRYGVWSTSVAGLAYLGGLCTPGQNVALAEDTALSYSSVHNVAHELGHLLGAPHDGSVTASSCRFSDGYMMGYDSKGVNHYTFSVCSQKTIRAHLKSANKSCVAAMATPVYETPIGLPGKNINLDKYCNMVDKKMTFARLSVDARSRCDMRCCRTLWNGLGLECVTTSALDGSTCNAAKGHVCINGLCGKEEDLVKPRRPGGA